MSEFEEEQIEPTNTQYGYGNNDENIAYPQRNVPQFNSNTRTVYEPNVWQEQKTESNSQIYGSQKLVNEHNRNHQSMSHDAYANIPYGGQRYQNEFNQNAFGAVSNQANHFDVATNQNPSEYPRRANNDDNRPQNNVMQDYCFIHPKVPLNCLMKKFVVGNYWFYDSYTRVCKLYTTNNCDDSKNKFKSLEACEGTCLEPHQLIQPLEPHEYQYGMGMEQSNSKPYSVASETSNQGKNAAGRWSF